MTIFVTGGTGYIGSHTAVKLLECGYDVVIADNFTNSKPDVAERIKKIAKRDFVFYEADICSKEQLDNIFSENKIDCVIHFAGLKAVGESVSIPLEYYSNNLNSTINLCSAMMKYNVSKMIFSSSATVYSMSASMPLTEDSPTGGCVNPYGWTKFMCEQIITDAAGAAGDWSVALLRYFNPIGAHESGLIGDDPQDIPNNLMPYVAQTAIGKFPHLSIYGNDYDTPDGTCIRDYIHVEDLASGHVAAIDYLNLNDGLCIFNLGTGRGVSVLELVAAFEKAAGVKINTEITSRRPGDGPVSYAATGKAKELLGWEAKKSLAEACEDTWRWQTRASAAT